MRIERRAAACSPIPYSGSPASPNPFTSAAILKLVEQGKLKLDDKAFSYLKDLRAPEGSTPDPRLASIAIRQLLQHTGGWDRDVSFDPMFHETMFRPDGTAESVVRNMLGVSLDFNPGTREAYSNFGYCVLGRIIEHVAGVPYAEFVQREILRPVGITDMRIGSLQHLAANEVRYYDAPERFHLEAMDSHGGWIASALDLVKFANTLPLSSQALREIAARPALPLPRDTAAYYGLGWQIRPVGNGANWWHTGSLPGTITLLVRTHHGYCWAVLFNSRPPDRKLPGELDAGMWKALAASGL